MAENQTPTLLINTQYIKDLSFENPNAPEVYAKITEAPPDITFNLDVTPTHLHDRSYEVVLSLHTKAVCGEMVAFLVELDHAAIVTLGESVPEDVVEQLLVTEVPRYIFPFSRAILADVTREAAFPPLVINPIDFKQFYEHRKMVAAQAANAKEPAAQAANAEEPAAPDADGGKPAAPKTG
ncbi:MAG: protein-export chaperone SecB [Kiloniellales bacterium]